jgi:drug/metabolite transporter (DMT)-like permease
MHLQSHKFEFPFDVYVIRWIAFVAFLSMKSENAIDIDANSANESRREKQKTSLTPLIIACLAATWLVWGSTYLAIKFALVSFPPFVQMGSRFIVAGVALALWMRYVRNAPWPTLIQWRNATVIGALMLGCGMGGTAYSEQTIGSGLVVAFIAVVPVMMALGNLLWKIYPSRLEAAGIGVGLAGVLMLTQGAGFQSSTAGLIAIAIACVAWSTGSLLSQRVPALAMAPGAMGFASEMIGGGIVLMAMAAINGEYVTLRSSWPPQPLATAAWFYLVVFGSLIAFNAYMVLLAKSSAALAASYCFVTPVIAMVLGIVFAGEVVSGFEWAAAGVVLVGVILVLSGRK